MSNKNIIIELTEFERDFILTKIRWSLSDDFKSCLKKAKVNKNGFINLGVRLYELTDLIGNLSLEGNHTENGQTQDTAYALAEHLESYEFLLQ